MQSPAEVRCAGVESDAGAAATVAGVGVDETDRLLRVLFESMGEGVVMLDDHARVIAANPAAERMLGIPLDRLLGGSPLDAGWQAVHADGTELAGQDHPGVRTLRTGTPTLDVTIGSARPDGSFTWVLASSHPVVAPGTNRCIAAVTTIVDVTERVERDRARRRDEEAFRELTELSEDLITWHDVEGRVRYASDASQRLLGLPPGDLVGRSLGRWCHPDDRGLIVEVGLRAVQSGGDALEPVTWRAVLADGTLRHIDTRARVRWDPDTGHQLGFVAYSRDVSDAVESAAALSHSEAQFRAVAESAPIGILGGDRLGRCTYANAKAAAICGIPIDDLVGRSFIEWIHVGDHPLVQAAWRDTVGSGAELDVEVRVVRPDGSERWCRVQASQIDRTGRRAMSVVGSMEDITEARSARLLVESMQARFSAAFTGSPIASALVATCGTIEDQNPAWVALAGDRAVSGTELRDVVQPDHAAEIDRLVAEVAASPDRSSVAEVRLADVDGSTRWAQLHVGVLPASILLSERLLVQLIDVTTQRELEDRLRALADLDPLTGALNRRSFDEMMDRYAAHRPAGTTSALAMLDLDHFKAVNDTLGHQQGDDVLVGVVAALRGALRPGDHLARLGGDEFAVVLPGIERDDAEQVASRLVQAVREFAAGRPMDVERAVTVSIGLSLCDGSRHPHDVLAAADRALYRAKAAGRDQWAAEQVCG